MSARSEVQPPATIRRSAPWISCFVLLGGLGCVRCSGSAPAAAARLDDAGATDVDLPRGVDAPRDAEVAGDVDSPGDAGTLRPVDTSTGHPVVASGDLSLEVDPQVGARFVSFARGGTNWLSPAAANPTNYGSTFWTSPQSDWNWPPPPEIDNLPYQTSVDGATLTLRGAENGALGLRVSKTVSPWVSASSSGAMSIQYVVENDGAASRSIAPWEITRVRPEGVIFFPTGAGPAYSADAGPPLPTRQAAGATWFDVATLPAGSASIKYFADGARGWVAHLRGGMLFVKKFADIAPSDAAPGEAEIEVYVNGDRAYIELEVQGAYRPIAPGATLAWPMRWFLVPVPAGVDASAGSASLVAFVDGL